ncbi:A-kinase interacting protein 1 [Phyllostomus discolor]|uniref:A-kinase interacting protein 1 n=1 Tax=Phyllostomus discolor TaxID=89673 RepID=A0A833ZSP0_9CHIR|nr:A-kinase interacting protein 1 [Phyllostomus discolor]
MGWVYMENCLAAAALNGVDRRSLQRSARLGQEVLERAKRRAVDWHSLEFPKGSVGAISQERPYGERWPAAGPERLLLGEREERRPTLSASFRTMAEFMDYTSSQCGADNISKDLYIEVYPGTYSVTVGANDLTKKTQVVAVDSGQSVDLVFPI